MKNVIRVIRAIDDFVLNDFPRVQAITSFFARCGITKQWLSMLVMLGAAIWLIRDLLQAAQQKVVETGVYEWDLFIVKLCVQFFAHGVLVYKAPSNDHGSRNPIISADIFLLYRTFILLATMCVWTYMTWIIGSDSEDANSIIWMFCWTFATYVIACDSAPSSN